MTAHWRSPVAAAILSATFSFAAAGASAAPTDPSKTCSADGGTLRGDVDGDRTADRVSVRRCALVVTDRARRLTRSLASYADERLPRLNALAQLDGSRGLEIVVDLVSGASSGFVGVFKVQGERLVRMAVAGEGPALFAYAGSVRRLQGVDCARGGGIVLGFAVHVNGGYSVERLFFRVVGTAFHQQPSRTQRIRVRGESLDPKRFPEFAGRPFPHCGGVRS